MKKLYSNIRQLTLANRLTELFASRLNPFVICYHQIEENEMLQHVIYLQRHFKIKKLSDLTRESYGSCAITVDDCIREDFTKSLNIAEKKSCPITFYLPTYYSSNNLSIWPVKIKWAMSIKDNKNWRNEFNKLCIDWMNSGNQTSQLEIKADSILSQKYNLDIKNIPDRLRVVSPEDIIKCRSNEFVSIESHSVNHPFFYLCTDSEIEDELNNSKIYIESLTEKEVTSFCYPYGSKKIIGVNAPIQTSNIYNNATTLIPGVLSDNNLHYIPRIGIYPGDSINQLATKIYHYQNLRLFGLS